MTTRLCRATQLSPLASWDMGRLLLRPTTLRRGRAILQRHPVNVGVMLDIASYDPALAYLLIRTANFERVAEPPIYRLDLALKYSGFEAVEEIFERAEAAASAGERLEDVGAHSRLTAVLARRFAAITGIVDTDCAYVAGLLHDVGKLPPIADPELLWPDHTTLGEEMLLDAAGPEFLAEVAARHHRVVDESGDSTLLAMVSLANKIAHNIEGSAAVPDFATSAILKSAFEQLERQRQVYH